EHVGADIDIRRKSLVHAGRRRQDEQDLQDEVGRCLPHPVNPVHPVFVFLRGPSWLFVDQALSPYNDALEHVDHGAPSWDCRRSPSSDGPTSANRRCSTGWPAGASPSLTRPPASRATGSPPRSRSMIATSS